MRVIREQSVTAFADLVLPWLLRDPVRNNVAAQQVQGRVDGTMPTEDGALWLLIEDAGHLASIALRTPPNALLLTAAVPEAITALTDWCLENEPRLPGVNGPIAESDAFAQQWGERTGAAVELVMGNRMFRLDRVIHPQGVRGQARLATADDRELLVSWATAFHHEATPQWPMLDYELLIDRKLGGDHLWVWVDGEPVSMLWTNPAISGVVRLSGVFTPPEHRGHGYAGGCVAAVSQHELDTRAFACSLYTDLANPTSNKIYQSLGYEPVMDARQWGFTYAD
ncbi:putative GNAT family acetyltransferase [Allocatelliglobosispora scoriae]|uniref:Putative GNAT family acetyltransferase n=1 Tax=Allocatelliglobosispora scoriae TaxID=643052 RepID=A0A841BSC6_9ACTN|nr:GNAT family N-acetyltransferase [Allocatelliglobosispora scoriae]MBB5869813.1 putative GNAT family acetyltransferase [Allocatelliglobosispora scoriae]